MEIKILLHVTDIWFFFNERRQYWDIQIQIFEYLLFENISGGKNDGRAN
jgi:hypothetical protein